MYGAAYEGHVDRRAAGQEQPTADACEPSADLVQ